MSMFESKRGKHLCRRLCSHGWGVHLCSFVRGSRYHRLEQGINRHGGLVVFFLNLKQLLLGHRPQWLDFCTHSITHCRA